MQNVKPIFYTSLFFLFFFFETTSIYANHLVGGELTYECLGGDQFRIDLTIYRDCNSDGAPFDAVAALYLKDPNTETYLEYEGDFAIPISLNVSDTLEIPTEDSISNCPLSLANICVSRAIYSIELDLLPKAGGYEIIYQRCCRNTGIINIDAPGETGSTYTAFIPHETESDCANSSPYFINYPPTAICSGEPLLFDHSAIDLEGDSLIYSLCTPLDGAATNCPGNPLFDGVTGGYVGPNFCDTTANGSLVPSTFNPILWLGDFSENDPLGNPENPLNIDSETGILTGVPNNLGLYVVGVCVAEYRNGALIGTHSRDFQFNVIACEETSIGNGTFANASNVAGEYFFEICGGEPLSFANTGFPNVDFFWDFGIVDGVETTSTQRNPSTTYTEGGNYEVVLMLDGGGDCQYSDTLFVEVVICSGLETINEIDCRIAPNPFSGEFTMQYELSSPSELKVVLYNQLGQELILTEAFKTIGQQKESYSLDLSKGLYFLSVFSEDQLVYSERLIKVE